MTRHCQTCGQPTEEAFHIPWLGKFYRCENGHSEVRGPEGTREAPDQLAVERLRDCREFAVKFARKKARSRCVVGDGAAPSRA